MLLPFANLQIKHWNPGASQPLVLPLHLVCNTSDEEVDNNIRANSARPGNWMASKDAHQGIAILCGSGPSLAESLDEIKALIATGGTVFAMNGSAKFLHEHGIMPDYQLMIDPRQQTADLIGPAKTHLFASQCHPLCFERMPSATLWHLQIEGIDLLLPTYDRPFALIGGAASVGNTALCVAYAKGFRHLHVFGYDSSHRGHQSHAFRQSMNDGEPCCVVTFAGKTYPTSLTMKHQAEKFQVTARALVNAGCTLSVHGDGLLPDMWNTPPEQLTERDKYERMWRVEGYRLYSPGEECVDVFLDIVKPTGTVIDFGCGTGRAGLAINKAGHDVVLVDFASNCRDPEALSLPFYEFDLSEPMPFRVGYGYCTDVMEHIEPDKVDTVIGNIMASAEIVFFQISTVPDMAGAAINQTLHLTVEPHAAWLERFRRLGYQIPWDQRGQDASQFIVARTQQ